jgi:hypothetical protein
MAWEKRGDKMYYYQARRVEGKVTKTYCGCDETANLIAGLDEKLREQENEQKNWGRTKRIEQSQDDVALLLFLNQTKAMAYHSIQAAGYHRPTRNKWRRKQMKSEEQHTVEGLDTAHEVSACGLIITPFKSGEVAEMQQELAQGMAEYPRLASLINGGIDSVIERMTVLNHDEKENELLRLNAKAEIMALMGTHTAPAIMLLASRVVVTRYNLSACEYSYASDVSSYQSGIEMYYEGYLHYTKKSTSGMTMTLKGYEALRPKPEPVDTNYHEKRIERAQRQHLEALKVLLAAQQLDLRTTVAPTRVKGITGN